MKIQKTFDGQDFSRAAAFLKEMANEKRLHVLCLLLEGERCVGEIAQMVGLSPSALSQHLARLRDAGLVSCRKTHQTVFYRLASPVAVGMIDTLRRHFCTGGKE